MTNFYKQFDKYLMNITACMFTQIPKDMCAVNTFLHQPILYIQPAVIKMTPKIYTAGNFEIIDRGCWYTQPQNRIGHARIYNVKYHIYCKLAIRLHDQQQLNSTYVNVYCAVYTNEQDYTYFYTAEIPVYNCVV